MKTLLQQRDILLQQIRKNESEISKKLRIAYKKLQETVPSKPYKDSKILRVVRFKDLNTWNIDNNENAIINYLQYKILEDNLLSAVYKRRTPLEQISFIKSLHQRICKTAWDGAVMCKPYNTIYEDIKLSIEKFGKKDSFAYPFGHYNDNTIKALKANGIRLAFTINEGNVKRKNNKYKLPRVRIASWTTMDTYKKLVK
jgi:hypothetical protein